jgi:hypothetical protein
MKSESERYDRQPQNYGPPPTIRRATRFSDGKPVLVIESGAITAILEISAEMNTAIEAAGG